MRLHYIPLFISFVAFAKGDLPPGVQCPRLPSFSEALGFHINIAAGDVENAVRPAPVSEAGSPPPPAKAGPNWPTVLESAGFHLDIAARDVSRWLTQAGEDIARELGSVDIGDSQRFFRTAADRRGAPAAPLPGLLENPGLHLSIAAGDVGQGLERLFRAAALWTDEANANLQRDPGRTVLKAALDGARAGLLFVPGMLWGPVLNVLGFSIGGVVPATVASAAHSYFRIVASGSRFATLQSAAAGGYGAAALNRLVRGGVLAWIGTDWINEIRQRWVE